MNHSASTATDRTQFAARLLGHVAAIAAAAVMTLAATAALADVPATETTPAQATVHFADLDLTTARGKAQLGQRIARAANAACAPARDNPDRLASQAAFGACRSAAIGQARQRLAARATPIHLAAR